MILLTCSKCETSLKVKAEAAGRRIYCPRCRHVNAVPLPPTTATVTFGQEPAEQATLPPIPEATLPPAVHDAATLPPDGHKDRKASAEATIASPAGYEILGELGRGGMGVVYKARQTKLQRTVALKMILGGGHASGADLDRFRTEAESIARLQHPNIVQIYEIGEWRPGGDNQPLPFFSLEYCSGGSLEKKLAGTPLPPREAAALVQKLAQAMQAAHDQGVIHRDLKPANILLQMDVRKSPTDDGEPAQIPKITDFGLAKKLDETGHTRSGSIMGTPSYMAPEQAGGKTKELGPACDIYALGAILYDCLTGRPPFRAATPLDTVLQVVSDEAVPPSQLNAKVPRDLETICLKCLQKEPGKRYATAARLAQDLARFQAGEPIAARPVSRLERTVKWSRRRPAAAALLVVSALALVALAAGGVFYWTELQDHAAKLQDALNETTAAAAKARLAEAQAKASQSDAQWHAAKAQESLKVAQERLQQSRFSAYNWQLGQVVSLADRDPERAADLLEDAGRFPWDLRDFAWEFLHGMGRPLYRWNGANRDLQMKWFNYVECGKFPGGLALSPDGKRLASAIPWGSNARGSGKAKGRVTFLDLTTGSPAGFLDDEGGQVLGLAFSSDGKWLATGGGKGVRLWDAASLQPQHLFSQPENEKRSGSFALAFAPDSRTLAVNHGNFTDLWDVATGEVRAKLEGHTGQVWCLAFSHDGKLLATGGADKTIRLWDPGAGKELALLNPKTMNEVVCVAFAPDGKTLAAAERGNKDVLLWDVAGRQVRARFSGHTMPVYALAYSADGAALVSAAYDDVSKPGGDPLSKTAKGELKLWDAPTGRERLSPLAQVPRMHAVALLPEGRLAAADLEGAVTVWQTGGRERPSEEIRLQGTFAAYAPEAGLGVRTSFRRRTRFGKPGSTEELDFVPQQATMLARSPDGQRVAWALEGGRVQSWEIATGITHPPLPPRDGLVELAFAPDHQTLVLTLNVKTPAGLAYQVEMWDPATQRELFRFPGTQPVFAPNGKQVVVNDPLARKLRWLSLPDGKELLGVAAPKMPLPPPALFSANGSTLMLRGDKAFTFWDTSSAKKRDAELTVANGEIAALPAVLSPDGKLVVVSDIFKQAIRLLDLETGKESSLPKVVGLAFEPATFSPDGRMLAVRVYDKVSLCDVASRELLTSVPCMYEPLNPSPVVAFSPAGDTIALGSRKVVLWDIAQRKERATLTGHGGQARIAAYSADGQTLATVNGDPKAIGEVILWDAASGKERATLPGQARAAFAPDGRLATAAKNEVRLWEPVSQGDWQKRGILAAVHQGDVVALSFAAGGCLVSASDDPQLELVEPRSGKVQHTLPIRQAVVTHVAISTDAAVAATGSADGVVKVWDVARSQEKFAFAEASKAVLALALDQRGSLLVVAGADQAVTVWDLASGKEKARLPETLAAIQSVAISPDGRTVAVAGGTGSPLPGEWKVRVHLWNLDLQKIRSTTQLEVTSIVGLAFAPSGDTFAGLGLETVQPGKVQNPMRPEGKEILFVWDTLMGQERLSLSRRVSGFMNSGRGLAFSADGSNLLTWGQFAYSAVLCRWGSPPARRDTALRIDNRLGGGAFAIAPDGRTGALFVDGQVRLVDLPTGEERGRLPTGAKSAQALVFAPDGKLLAAAVDDGAQLWDLIEAKKTLTLPTAKAMNAVVFLPAGKKVVTGSADGKVLLWDIGTAGKPAPLLSLNSGIVHLAIAADGKTLLVAAQDGSVRLVDLQDGTERTMRPGAGFIQCMNANGLIVASGNGMARVLDSLTGGERASLLIGPRGGRVLFALSADATLLACWADDELTIWDVPAKQERASLRARAREVKQIVFGPDGQTVVACGANLNVWEVPPRRPR